MLDGDGEGEGEGEEGKWSDELRAEGKVDDGFEQLKVETGDEDVDYEEHKREVSPSREFAGCTPRAKRSPSAGGGGARNKLNAACVCASLLLPAAAACCCLLLSAAAAGCPHAVDRLATDPAGGPPVCGRRGC